MTSAMARRSLRLAAVYDEASPAWQDFYPEDLPDDWRFAYFAHFWPNLLIPAGAWERFASSIDWVTEVPDTLRLYFEIPDVPKPANEVLPRLASALGSRLGGILCADCTEPPADPHIRQHWFVPVPVPAVAGVEEATAFAAAGLKVFRLRPEPGLSLPRWRSLLEQVHASTGGLLAALVFLEVGPRELETAETILRLSGLESVARED